MEFNLLHFLLTLGVIAAGLYLYGNPILLKRQSKLVRGVIIWMALVIALHGLDYIFFANP